MRATAARASGARALRPTLLLLLFALVAATPADARADEPLAPPYKEMVRRMAQRGPADTLGDGVFALGEEAFRAGAFDDAMRRFGEFAQRFPRNLKVNDALERILLIRDGRDFDEGPLKLYARAEALRSADRADSARTLLETALQRYPGAHIRGHLRYGLAEIARANGEHALAIEHALAVADTAAHSRLAPYALQLAGDATLASGGSPDRAAGFYQSLLERFPESPLAPSVRARLLLLRKRMQL